MLIREYVPADLDALRRMHAAQGFGYPFPDLDSPLFIANLILEDDGDPCDAGPSFRRDRDAERSVGADVSDPAETKAQDSENAPAEARAGRSSREAAHQNSPPADCSRNPPTQIAMAVLLRLTAEAYLLHDPAAGTPLRRWQQFLALHDAAHATAAARGLDDVQAFLPPSIARAFGRRLAKLGWARDPWPCFSRRV